MSINFNDFKNNSYSSSLREFYKSLEKENIHLESDVTKKSIFFNISRGRFLQILRMKDRIGTANISQKFNVSENEYIKIESGSTSLADSLFFEICSFLNGSNEASIFLEKIEEAFKPEVKKARHEMAESLKNQFGIRFSDSDKYDKSKKGKVLTFDFKKKEK